MQDGSLEGAEEPPVPPEPSEIVVVSGPGTRSVERRERARVTTSLHTRVAGLARVPSLSAIPSPSQFCFFLF